MGEFLRDFFATSSFMPHGHCFVWRPDILWARVIADGIIALAYYSIPIALFYFVRKRRDMAYNWIFLLFGAFILACGTTHVLDIITVWYPLYGLEALTKAVTAAIS